ncbi:response regulator [Desertibaculum subflavum]|uniref:response regulator n=1 Tax=Desertibaculum subflavum TaxID=2268458 RepID=UPI000E6628FF
MARIVVIDDEEIFRSLTARLLRGAGHEVRVFAQADDALAAIEAAGADLLLTDLFMPGKEGFETIREARRRWPTLPVIVVSGGGSGQFGGPDEFLGFARRFGAAAALSKPFRAEALLGAVDRALSEAPPAADRPAVVETAD